MVKTWKGFLSESTSFHYTTLKVIKRMSCEQSIIFFPILADIPNLKYQCLPLLIITVCVMSKVSYFWHKIPFFWQYSHIMGDICKCKELFCIVSNLFFHKLNTICKYPIIKACRTSRHVLASSTMEPKNFRKSHFDNLLDFTRYFFRSS